MYSSVTVNKTKDFGDWWISLTSKNLPYPPKLPYSIYGIFFYKKGKGLLIGTSLTYTKDDFKTYERIDFLSDDDAYYNCEFLKNGYGIMTCARDWHYFYNWLVLSKDFGKHRGTYELEDNTNWSIKYQENFHIGACEKDTTFFVVTEQLYGQKSCLSRITPADFDSLNLQPLGMHNPTTNATVTISPNQTSSVFSIFCDKPLKKIAVFDLQGKEIYSRKCDNEENVSVDATAWASGTYIVRVQTKYGFGEAKVLKK